MDNKTREAVFDKLERIRALCANPHWEAARRWRIEELAAEAQQLLTKGVQRER